MCQDVSQWLTPTIQCLLLRQARGMAIHGLIVEPSYIPYAHSLHGFGWSESRQNYIMAVMEEAASTGIVLALK